MVKVKDLAVIAGVAVVGYLAYNFLKGGLGDLLPKLPAPVVGLDPYAGPTEPAPPITPVYEIPKDWGTTPVDLPPGSLVVWRGGPFGESPSTVSYPSSPVNMAGIGTGAGFWQLLGFPPEKPKGGTTKPTTTEYRPRTFPAGTPLVQLPGPLDPITVPEYKQLKTIVPDPSQFARKIKHGGIAAL